MGRGERLPGAHLPVRGLQGCDHRAGDLGRGVPGPEVDPPERVHRDLGEELGIHPSGGVVTSGDEDRGVLDRAGDRAHSPAPSGIPETLDRTREGDRTAREEAHLRRAYPEPVGDDLAGLVEEPASRSRLGVEPSRVGPSDLEGGHEGLAGGRVQGGRRPVEENPRRGLFRRIRHTVTLVPPSRVSRPPRG